MIQALTVFAKQLLVAGGFKVSEFPRKAYRELLTGLTDMQTGEVTILPGMVELAKTHPGYLVVDDTKNPKYGLLHLAKKLKILTNGATRTGYEVLLLLWVVPGMGRFPLGFALSYKGTHSPAELALQGMGILRNRYDLRPRAILADGAFSTDATLKRLTDYGWTFVMRGRNNRSVSGSAVKRLIPRGYGETEGFLKNGVKLKIVRDRKHFLFCKGKPFNRFTGCVGKLRRCSGYSKAGLGSAAVSNTLCGLKAFLFPPAFCYFRVWRSFRVASPTRPWLMSIPDSSSLKT
jgi:hypothetical protein